ncbi:hypothetical protein [Hyphomicrobium sulfonivorans]|uniref:hypothetical protein n=1 Tax=Hyphomicrobium sulfonivorans TaxID=121290 RepID=UPI001570E903|nr:hypothetical protein [Hyphomicrobium sulfonivorans]MBI1649881.1 hypothetical protein [Hyphomicrobium sulfonivorans]NSL71792.1 hypothetical protein [Hyphomicrobium sulfonivorans]
MRRIDAYRIKRGENLGDPETWNRRFEDLDLRIAQSEDALQNVDAVANRVEAVALDRLNNVITPLVNEARDRLGNVATIFDATSTTPLNIQLGAAIINIAEYERDTFTPMSYVMIFPPDDMERYMAGRTVEYDRRTGDLTIDVSRTQGEGIVSNWLVTPIVMATNIEQVVEDVSNARVAVLGFKAEVEAYRTQVQDMAGSVAQSRTFAEQARDLAGAHAGAALAYKTASEAARDQAQTYRNQAAAIVGLDPNDYQARAERNMANGYAGLDANGRIASSMLPTLPVSKGGTGATTPGDALEALGAQARLSYTPARADRKIMTGSGLIGGGTLKEDRTLAIDKASPANIRAAALNKVVTADGVATAMDWVALEDAPSIEVDHADGVNRVLTLGDNNAFANPTNGKPGYPLNIRIKQDAIGARVPSWGAAYDFDGVAPLLSPEPGAEDLVSFICITPGKFACIGIRRRID